MTNYKVILRLKSLGMTHAYIAASCGCGRNTVTRVLNRAREYGLTWETAQKLAPNEIQKQLFPADVAKPTCCCSHELSLNRPEF